MIKRTVQSKRKPRRGAAVVEFAICVPFLILIFVGAVDYCRIYYGALTVSNASRNAGYEAFDPNSGYTSPYYDASGMTKTCQNAVDGDCTNLGSAGKVTLTYSQTGNPNTDGNPQYATVSSNYKFNTISNYPGLPVASELNRIIVVRIAPSTN